MVMELKFEKKKEPEKTGSDPDSTEGNEDAKNEDKK